jgi:flagellar hook-length control protein FliK
MLDASAASPNAAATPDATGAADTGSIQAKPADILTAWQAKIAQSSSDPVASAAGTAADAPAAFTAVAITPAMTVDLALLVQAVPAEPSAAAAAPADAKQTSGGGDKAAAGAGVTKADSKTADGGNDADADVTPDTKADAAAAAIAPAPAAVVAVAVTVPPLAIPAVPPIASPAVAPIASPVTAPAKPASDIAGIAPVQLQAAPALPADRAAPETPDQIAAAPDAPDSPAAGKSGVTPAKPQQKADATAGDADGAPANADDAGEVKTQPKVSSVAADAVQAAAPEGTDKPAIETESLPAPAEAKSLARPERKAEAKAKSGQPGEAPATQTRPSSDSARPAVAPAEQDADGKAPTAHQPHAQPAEHAALSLRLAPAEARGDATIPVAAGPQPAQANTNLSSLALNLAAPVSSPLAALSPFMALRVDQTDNNPLPIAGLAVEIVSRAQDGSRRFDIRLDPPELGRIDVRLDVDSGGNVTSRLTVERADTLDLLRRDAPQLERALQHAGLNTEGGLQFSLRDQNFANREQMPRDAAPTHLIVPDDELAAADAARRGYGRLIGLGGGIDIRV